MYFVVYISSSVLKFSHPELVAIMEKSVKNNARLGITGMLLYKDGNLMQVLEGEETAVRALYAKISLDPRHRGLITLMEGHQEGRQFPGWSMGFTDLNTADAIASPGYNEFLNRPLTGAEFSKDPTSCQRLLMSFKKSMSK